MRRMFMVWAPFRHELRQPLVVVTGVRVAGGMVVDQGYLCGALQQGFAQDAAHVGGSLVDAAAADAYFVYDAGEPGSEAVPRILLWQGRRAAGWNRSRRCRRKSGWRHVPERSCSLRRLPSSRAAMTVMLLAGPDAFESGEVPHLPFAQAVEVVAAGGEYALHQCHGGFFRIAGADEDG